MNFLVWRGTSGYFSRVPRLPRIGILPALAGMLLGVPDGHSQDTGNRDDRVSITPFAVVEAGGDAVGFEEVSPDRIGIDFRNDLAEESALLNQILLNGSGVAAGDVDGDGWTDLYFCGLNSANRLYRNAGNWRFEDVTPESIRCADQFSMGCALADLDGDGDLDLLVTGSRRGVRYFANQGNFQFEERTVALGLGSTHGSHSLAIADVDGDGWLDLYVVNYRNETMRDLVDPEFAVSMKNGKPMLVRFNGRPGSHPDLVGRFSFDQGAGVLENGQADVFYRNRQGRGFDAVPWDGGAFFDESGKVSETPYDWGLSAMFRDLNGDRRPDLYVCNDFQSPDRIWINQGEGVFRAIDRGAIRQTSLFSMGIDGADIDADGSLDLFIADMLSRDPARRQVQVMDAMAFGQFRGILDDRPQTPRNTLFVSRGDGTYAEVARWAGVEASDWSWCPAFMDVDLDGHPDLLITTGHGRDAQNVDVARAIDEAIRRDQVAGTEQLRLRRLFPKLETPNVAFRNRGDGRFEEVGEAWGFASSQISHGLALADLDNDGDQDVIVTCLNAPPLLYRNRSQRPRLLVRLDGQGGNTRGVGAQLRLTQPRSGMPPQQREVISGGRYLSCDAAEAVFGLDAKPDDETVLEVMWRSGRITRIANPPRNVLITVSESAASDTESRPRERAEFAATLFQEVSERLGYEHRDLAFDDLARQPLMPRRLSTLCPGAAWYDFTGDGWDDLILGSGRGGRLGVYRNDRQGGFIRQKAAILDGPRALDDTTILGWRPSPTDSRLLFGTAAYERGGPAAAAVASLSLTTGQLDNGLATLPASVGPMAMADVDRDGDLDLFVGGRVLPGAYPVPASSVLLVNDGGQLSLDAELSRPFRDIGLVSGACFTDWNSDGWPDLALACEWGPIELFINVRGVFEKRPVDVRWTGWIARPGMTQYVSTLSAMTGFWTSVAPGDFDNDGRMDLAVGNWGLNGPGSGVEFAPHRLYYEEAEARRRTRVGLLEARLDPATGRYLPTRDWGALKAVFPELGRRYHSYEAFSTVDIPRLQAEGLLPGHFVEAAVFESVVLLNRGDDAVEVKALPREAQWAPVFGIATGDWNGDAIEDLILAQNFFDVAPGGSRWDAGLGMWLRGRGRGEFEAIPARESGLRVEGQGRGVAVADYNLDGRIDLVVAQHGGPAKLFQNVGGPPGFPVALAGSESNPRAVGARARIVFDDGKVGPWHEIRLGGGYWSQDASTFVLATPSGAKSLEIHWPNGLEERIPLPGGDFLGRLLRRSMPESP